MSASSRAGVAWLALLVLVLLGGMIAGIAMGLDRDPIGMGAMAIWAGLGISAGLLLLWANNPMRSSAARAVWIVLCLLPIVLLLACRTIALSAP